MVEKIVFLWSKVTNGAISTILGNNKFKRAGGLVDLKIRKSALLSLNHHNFSNTEPI